MPIVKIDDKEYDFDSLPKNAKDQLQSLQFVDNELDRHQAHGAVLRTARAAYAKALQEALFNAPTVMGGDTIKLG